MLVIGYFYAIYAPSRGYLINNLIICDWIKQTVALLMSAGSSSDMQPLVYLKKGYISAEMSSERATYCSWSPVVAVDKTVLAIQVIIFRKLRGEITDMSNIFIFLTDLV